MIRLMVTGTPAPKGSRTLGRRRDGSAFTRPASSGEHGWVEAVARAAQWRRAQALEVPEAGELPAPPYAVELLFLMPRPKRPTHGWPTRTDLDKLCRAVLDGLVRGGLLVDDRHVVELRAVKRWTAAPGGEGAQVTISAAEARTPSSRGIARGDAAQLVSGRSHAVGEQS